MKPYRQVKELPRVYIAGKLNDMASDYVKNVHNMIKNAEEVRKQGFAVFVPGIDLLCGLQTGNWDYKDYFDNSQPWLDVSDAIYVGESWRESGGTIREIKRAKDKMIPRFFKECDGLAQIKEFFYGMKDWVEPFYIDEPKDLEKILCHT